MAYPTAAQLTWVATDQWMGAQPLMTTSTTQAHALGTVVKGADTGTLGYGEEQFIYLKGVASTAAGDAVIYDTVAATTTRSVAASKGPVAIALSANVASQYGWYQIFGNAVVATTGLAANGMMGTIATAGTLGVTGAGIKVDGAVAKAATNTPTTGFSQVLLTFPAANGNG